MEELKQSTPLLPDFCSLLVIDGDAIPYIIGWNNREHTDVPTVHASIDQWMKEFLTITGARQFIGILAADNARCFRYDTYKYKLYKGNRKEKDEWIKFWEPIIRKQLVDIWGFIYSPINLETDDVVATLALKNPRAIICSPDKDLKQIAGYFYNYKDFGGESHKGLEIITNEQALYNLHFQLLVGDSTDNVNGCTGMGEVKAKKLLEETNSMMWTNAVKLCYHKQYGSYYGDIIYQQTLEVIKMLTPLHPSWKQFEFSVKDYMDKIKNCDDYTGSFHKEVEREAFM